jgi:TetR/AcrR family transcriptional regulator, tetracycline repressor protein
MAKIRREEIIETALALLDEIGLDALTTRKIAARLNVESPTLYWHFRDKAALMSAMASAMIAKHHVLPVAENPALWADWLADNARSFRGALLACRDGARLHVGSSPEGDGGDRLRLKVGYLTKSGFMEHDARLALLTTGQFALASALEQQGYDAAAKPASITYDPDVAFEFGLRSMIDGLKRRLDAMA